MEKYAECVTRWLTDEGYTHCFFVPGGNSMHLLDGLRKKMTCIAFVHEMSAAIAAEYFNQVSEPTKAFVLLTAGPGLTNAITGIAGAFHEGRELLIIGGQVKSSDLSDGTIRQRGIQEVNGVDLVRPITVESVRLTKPIGRFKFSEIVRRQWKSTPGPVFIEMCLDVQGAPYEDHSGTHEPPSRKALYPKLTVNDGRKLADLIGHAERPILLIGGGVDHPNVQQALPGLERLGIPIMTTYNGADRLGHDHPLYFGRPNTWGMRYSNLLVGQADLIIALGSRLGLQQTGFNWQRFAPAGQIVHIDINENELHKGHPLTDLQIAADANDVISFLAGTAWEDRFRWVEYCRNMKKALPVSEPSNSKHDGFHNPYDFLLELSSIATGDDLVIPSSSGGAFTAFYQAFLNKSGQRIVSDKSLASMGYGYAGAIGAALANPEKRVLHVEGDGSFSQNLQELATARVRNLKIKTFLWSNEGYASIRMTQRNYFGGEYLGCDIDTGLGFPNWETLGEAYGIAVTPIDPGFSSLQEFKDQVSMAGPQIFIVNIHREQTFYPKISSRITATGGMESEPLWEISPHLTANELASWGKYLPTYGE
jgi:acetolactate synthase-1/2/3 large subunit